MRKDVKTGMLAGTVLCFIAIVWFCAKQQIVRQPLIKFESPGVFDLEDNEAVKAKDADVPALPEKPARVFNEPTHKPIQQQNQKTQKPDITKAFIVHTVMPGQTLSDISKIHYGSPSQWKKIYEANKRQFPKGPDAIIPGMKLTIPQ